MDPVIHYYLIRESINVKNNNYFLVIISVTIFLHSVMHSMLTYTLCHYKNL